MTKKEDEKLLRVLNQYSHIPINEQHKENVAATLKAFVPVCEQSTKVIFKQLFTQAIMEIWYSQKVTLCTLFLLLFGFYLVLPDSFDYKLLFLVTAPLPLFLISWRLFENLGEDMVELLLTYKYTFQQQLCAKIVAICSIAFIYYTVLGIYLMFTMNENLLQYVLQLMITGITPILFWALVLLIVHIQYRSYSVWIVFSMVWVLFSILIIYTPLGEMLLAVHVVFYVLFNSILFLTLVKLLMKTWQLERITVDW